MTTFAEIFASGFVDRLIAESKVAATAQGIELGQDAITKISRVAVLTAMEKGIPNDATIKAVAKAYVEMLIGNLS